MARAEEIAAWKARRWLVNLPIAATDIERQLERLFALQAVEVTALETQRNSDSLFRKLGRHLPSFDYSQYSGDPILLMSVYHALRKHGIDNPSLASVVSVYAEALDPHRNGLTPDLALVACLVRQCGFAVREPPRAMEKQLFSDTELVTCDRTRTLEICRLVTTLSACGTRRIDVGNAVLFLPHLAISYAMEWDIEAVSAILRICSYLDKCSDVACGWAKQWLLDQQQLDGRFGLLAPEARKMQYEDPNKWELYFCPTVSVLWCLGDICRPGFLLS